MLSAANITHTYPGAGGVRALDDVSIDVAPGQRLALAGPSGSGKSTLARVLAMVERPNAGTVTVDGVVVRSWGVATPRQLRRQVQLIWQSPRLSTDPRLRVRDIILEPMRAYGLLPGGRDSEDPVLRQWTARLGIPGELLHRFPQEVSDGQLQRACLARALAVEPRYLVCDEISSMLDVSTQAALLEVIRDVQRERDLGILMITHDHVLARHWCDAMLTIESGKLAVAAV